MDDKLHVWDFMEEFVAALQAQLESDEKRWGDAWLHVPVEGQVELIYAHLNTYLIKFRHADEPIPWLMVAGLAMIGWIRENHPEILSPES